MFSDRKREDRKGDKHSPNFVSYNFFKIKISICYRRYQPCDFRRIVEIFKTEGPGDWCSIPSRGKRDSSSLCVQNNSETNPASYWVGPCLGGKTQLRRHDEVLPLSIAKVSNDFLTFLLPA
jgi:hypothetical protein